ncbi:MAG: hypothetical protein R3B96_25130 [Pirellulaceae bacterium]
MVYPVGISATADGLIVADSRLPGLWRIVDGVATQEFHALMSDWPRSTSDALA